MEVQGSIDPTNVVLFVEINLKKKTLYKKE